VWLQNAFLAGGQSGMGVGARLPCPRHMGGTLSWHTRAPWSWSSGKKAKPRRAGFTLSVLR
jgi:hypothetical protein